MNEKERMPDVGSKIKKDTPGNYEDNAKAGKKVTRDEIGRTTSGGVNFGSV